MCTVGTNCVQCPPLGLAVIAVAERADSAVPRPPILAVAAAVALVSSGPRPALAQPGRPPCATCVALIADPAGVEATLAAGLPLGGVDVIVGSATSASPVLSEALARNGARVWMIAPATTAAGTPDALRALAGVFLLPPDLASGNAQEAVFAVRRAATDLRAVRPDLRVGLVLRPGLDTAAVAAAVAPYLDAVWLGPDLAADAKPIATRYAGQARWIERGAADVLAAGAGLTDETAVVDARGRTPALAAALAALRPLMPAGLTPLPEVRVTCSGCSADVWLHPETLDAIAVVRGAAAGSVVTIAPDALRVGRADLRGGAVSAMAIMRAADGVRVESAGDGDSLVLRIEGWRGDADAYATGVRVSASRPLSVDEIIARHQAQRARQARLVEHAIATGTTVLTFDVPGLAGPVESRRAPESSPAAP